ncbi:DMT family transporter [Paenibacillus sp. OSY-SE]|uniref:DMT family transporter n=1 Tax=Paenibacillus sp. OSY-SE TaxID=1196323 RepID=UPI0003038A5F|nr:DMT family transporter [Paenibacillus sp. OSY-SE]
MNRINYLLLLGIGLIWGSQFFFVDLVINSITPITLAACKALLGTITLATLHLFSGKKERTQGQSGIWKSLIWIGVLEAVVPFILIGWGQQYINSSTASILLGTVPIFTIIFVKIFAPDEKLPFKKWISVIMGFGGLCLLFAPDISSISFAGNFMGYVALLGASLSFAVSLLLIKRLPPMSSIVAMRNVLFVASVILLPLAFIFEDPLRVQLSWQQILDVIILGVLQAGIVYMLYNILIRRTSAAFASLTNYLVPLFGILLGTVVLGDQLTWNAIAALFVILVSLAVGEKSQTATSHQQP